ncbi:hypothetical protein DV736_g4186, partial [Chaetothyriales sp. CBS 134916]
MTTAPAPPSIVIDDPVTTSAAPPAAPAETTTARPKTKSPGPRLDTAPSTVGGAVDPHQSAAATAPGEEELTVAHKPFLRRPQSALTTGASEAHCFLCDEQNPGDFSPTTKFLDVCLLCSRYFCPVHKAFTTDQVCNINHSTYFHSMLGQLRGVLLAQQADLSAGGTTVGGRDLAEVLTAEGIFPSLGEREKAIFSTSPVDERKQRELEQFRSLEAALTNGVDGRGGKGQVEEKEFVGADVAV